MTKLTPCKEWELYRECNDPDEPAHCYHCGCHLDPQYGDCPNGCENPDGLELSEILRVNEQ